jgi:hypothetical protein
MNLRNEKARREREIERDKLFALSHAEVERLPHADQYQRMRYEREIEGNEYVYLLSKGYERGEAAIQARKNTDRIVANWTTAHGAG